MIKEAREREREGTRGIARGRKTDPEDEGDSGPPVAGLPLLPHKYGFSRAVYERKRVELREPGRA